MTAQEINAWTGPVLILGVVLLTVAMVLRLVRHWRTGRRAPLLLIRDVALFAALLLAIGGGQYSRMTGARLGEQVWWVVLSNAVYGCAIGLWLVIELALVGRDDPEEDA